MQRLFVTEYAEAAITLGGRLVQVPVEPPLAEQVLDFSAGVATSAAFNAKTQIVRIHSDAVCSVLFGTAPVATTATSRLGADMDRVVAVPRGASFKVSAIANI